MDALGTAPTISPMAASLSPEQMPEVMREITIMRGAILSVEKRVNELLAKITPVVRDSDTQQVPPNTPAEARPICNTEVGRLLAEMSASMGVIEDRVSYVLYRVEL